MTWSPSGDPPPGDRAAAGAIDLVMVPRAVDLGEMTVRRALPSTARQMIGPFIFFDQMGPAEFLTEQGIDVRPHPHINLSTLTYLFEGEILHRDSLGTELAIEPGAVNWMTAGRGIVHSERTSEARRQRGQTLFGLQTWMAMPASLEESAPAFEHVGKARLPTLQEEGISLRLIAGSAQGLVSPLQTPSDTLYADVELAAGSQLPVEPDVVERALYTIGGSLRIGRDDFVPGQLLVLRPGEQVLVEALTPARFMLFGGEPMDGPRYLWWNFVSSRRERIEQAREDWARARFDTVPGDATDFIPLPDNPAAPVRMGSMSIDH